MEIINFILRWVVLPLFSLIICKGLLAFCHFRGFHPEKWITWLLLRMSFSSPSERNAGWILAGIFSLFIGIPAVYLYPSFAISNIEKNQVDVIYEKRLTEKDIRTIKAILKVNNEKNHPRFLMDCLSTKYYCLQWKTVLKDAGWKEIEELRIKNGRVSVSKLNIERPLKDQVIILTLKDYKGENIWRDKLFQAFKYADMNPVEQPEENIGVNDFAIAIGAQ